MMTKSPCTPSRRQLRALLCACALVVAGIGSAAAFGPGMMQGSMMQGAMMGLGTPTPDAGADAGLSDPRAARLRDYIDAQGLPCLECHGIDRGGYGPLFALIAQRAAGRPGARAALSADIAQGVGGMPPGLASQAQAARLADLILALQRSAPATAQGR